MVVHLLDDQPAAERLPRERSPAGALHGRCRRRELLLEARKVAEVALESGSQLAVGPAAAVRRQVLPEQRVQHVPGDVERQALLELADVLEAPLVARVLE